MMEKNLKYYLNLQYTVRIKRNTDGSYFGEIEELPGCITEADNEEEIFEMLEDAMKVWLEEALRRGTAIPEPADDAYSGKFNVRVPKFLHRKLAYRAKSEGVSLNTLITTALSNSMK